MRWVYLVLLGVIVAVIVVFIAENRENETVTFFNQKITAPLSLYFVAVSFLGMGAAGPSSASSSGRTTAQPSARSRSGRRRRGNTMRKTTTRGAVAACRRGSSSP
jgi:hypothetical protein